jgi:integrase/recombinase XerD
MATVNLVSKVSRDKTKKWWYFEFGRGKGQRISTNKYTYIKPSSLLETRHNKTTIGELETQKAQKLLDLNAGRTPFLSEKKLPKNLLDFYKEFVDENKKERNRHLESSFNDFVKYLKAGPLKSQHSDKLFVDPEIVTEELCEKFRDWLVKNHTGETPANYFRRFKKMIRSATKRGYFRIDPCQDVQQKKGAENPKKDVLTVEEFRLLWKAPCHNPEVKKAFLFSYLTGLRGQALFSLTWGDIKESEYGPYISIIQDKTQRIVDVPLIQEALAILPHQRGGKDENVFSLPTTTEGYNKALKIWIQRDTGINKHITGHCARHSLGTILKESNSSDLMIADILGHSSTEHVQRYSRMLDLGKKKKSIEAAITKSSLGLGGLSHT